jgi:acyl-CoA synthetase (AMP-forming)/AMP-acid ligase II
MMSNWVTQRLQQFESQPVALSPSGSVNYGQLLQNIEQWHSAIDKWDIKAGDRVGLIGDYHIDVVALLLTLLARGCIVIPLSEDDRSLFEERLDICCATKVITVDNTVDINADTVSCQDHGNTDDTVHELMVPMSSIGKPGFVIFTSGSTGKGKAVLLDFAKMTAKFKDKVRTSFRTLLFLKLDHIGGMNTLFSVLFNGGTIVTSASRQAGDICQCVHKHQVELLPTTPSFLNMLLMSNMYSNYDLSSLKVITYGTEVMPNSTLASMAKVFPDIILKQTYGLSELGILSTKSKSNESKWMKIGGAGFDIKVKDDVLWIKSEQAMLGYLNAPSPFDEDGWYNTGDKVLVDGDYFQILGRESEIINVAGEKVYPIEVESFLLTLDNVKDVVVKCKKSPVVGQMIWAEFVLEKPEDKAAFKQRIVACAQDYFPAYKVPGLITIAKGDNLVGGRFKKIRKS